MKYLVRVTSKGGEDFGKHIIEIKNQALLQGDILMVIEAMPKVKRGD